METATSILLAEEDAVVRAFLAENLTADGYDVLVAEDHLAALTVLEADQPDLVICAPTGAPPRLLAPVRNAAGIASPIHPDVPLIVLTRRADELARVRYFDRGS